MEIYLDTKSHQLALEIGDPLLLLLPCKDSYDRAGNAIGSCRIHHVGELPRVQVRSPKGVRLNCAVSKVSGRRRSTVATRGFVLRSAVHRGTNPVGGANERRAKKDANTTSVMPSKSLARRMA